MSFLSIVIIFAVQIVFSRPLSEEQIYHRCHMDLVNQPVQTGDALLVEIQEGRLMSHQACEQILEISKLRKAGVRLTIADPSNEKAKRILKTMDDLHRSWFAKDDIPPLGNPCHERGARDTFDPSAPSAYLTRALFDTSYQYQEIFSGTTVLEPLRDGGVPDLGPISGLPIDAETNDSSGWPYRFGDSLLKIIRPFVEVGSLIGVKQISPSPIREGASVAENIGTDVNSSFGGGVLGSQTYLLVNVAEEAEFQADGSIKMPRRWSVNIFHDFFCREMPLLDLEDGASFVNSQAHAAFRKSSACTNCHATMDQMAGVARNLKYSFSQFSCGDPHQAFSFFTRNRIQTESLGNWLTFPRPDFSQSPPRGALFYKNYNNELINVSVTGFEQLGQAVRSQDDVYICAAKRYYRFLTGIDVPMHVGRKEVTERLKMHREVVIRAGKNLKSHQSTLRTIIELIQSPAYRDSKYLVNGH